MCATSIELITSGGAHCLPPLVMCFISVADNASHCCSASVRVRDVPHHASARVRDVLRLCVSPRCAALPPSHAAPASASPTTAVPAPALAAVCSAQPRIILSAASSYASEEREDAILHLLSWKVKLAPLLLSLLKKVLEMHSIRGEA